MSAEPRQVAVISKNIVEEVRVSLDHYAGRNLVDVRVYALFGGSEVHAPTKKGVSLAPSKLEELIAALTEAKAQAQAMGWV